MKGLSPDNITTNPDISLEVNSSICDRINKLHIRGHKLTKLDIITTCAWGQNKQVFGMLKGGTFVKMYKVPRFHNRFYSGIIILGQNQSRNLTYNLKGGRHTSFWEFHLKIPL